MNAAKKRSKAPAAAVEPTLQEKLPVEIRI